MALKPDETDARYLLDMLTYARALVRITSGRTLGDYRRDEDLRMTAERRIEIIGIAASRISEVFRTAHPEIPWHEIAAHRNLVARHCPLLLLAQMEHRTSGDAPDNCPCNQGNQAYDDIMWQVATASVPELIGLLEPLLPSQDEG